jgi:hypothetical protein
MADKKKMICNIVFLILVFTGTLYGVFHGEDLGEIVHILKTVNPLWLIPGVICRSIYLGRIHHHFLYDAYTWNQAEKMDLLFILLGRFFL